MRQTVCWFGYLVTASAGLALWIVLPFITGEAEAWNSSIYWCLAIPALTLICGLLGFVAPDRWWHWGLVAVSAQASVILARANWSTSNLLPLALLFLFLISTPYFVSGLVGSRIAAYWLRRHGTPGTP